LRNKKIRAKKMAIFGIGSSRRAERMAAKMRTVHKSILWPLPLYKAWPISFRGVGHRGAIVEEG
jgi:hypothetical protein